jgi:hypothetical protein
VTPDNFNPGNDAAPARTGRLRIACVYKRIPNMFNMSGIRFLKMSEALAQQGHEVDMASGREDVVSLGRRLRQVPLSLMKWSEYDVVKTFFHAGMDELIEAGGGDHPLIISKLGSVVGREMVEGVYFFGEERERLFRTQIEVARRSRVVTLLTNQSVVLWHREHGTGNQVLQVPTGVDAAIPESGENPYLSRGIHDRVALFAGHLYTRLHQPEVNLLWQERLNRLGLAFRRRGIRLVAIGTGEVDNLDPSLVLHCGTISSESIWNWQRFASVGIVLAQGRVQHNESSKIYYYLRSGLPTICEASVPNSWLISETGLGAIVPYNDDQAFCDAAEQLVRQPPRSATVQEYMVSGHSWQARAALYEPVFASIGAKNSSPRAI